MGPSRLLRSSRRTSIVLAVLVTACCAGGCRPKNSAGGAGPDGNVAVQPAWRKFAEANYYGVVQAGLPSSTMVTARFPNKPTVTASRAADGKVDLVAVGDVETNSPGGARMRYPASVMWHQSGGGWEMVFRNIGAGAPAPAQPSAPGMGPGVGPSTQPAAPAPPPDAAPAEPPAVPADPAGGAPGAP